MLHPSFAFLLIQLWLVFSGLHCWRKEYFLKQGVNKNLYIVNGIVTADIGQLLGLLLSCFRALFAVMKLAGLETFLGRKRCWPDIMVFFQLCRYMKLYIGLWSSSKNWTLWLMCMFGISLRKHTKNLIICSQIYLQFFSVARTCDVLWHAQKYNVFQGLCERTVHLEIGSLVV